MKIANNFLNATLINVGWGDSIFLETIDANGQSHFGLIDSNDTTYLRSSFIYLKRYFEKKDINISKRFPLFDFVILSHAHADHGQGLKALFRAFGTNYFWYPKTIDWSSLIELIRYSNRSRTVLHHQAIDSSKVMPKFGNIDMQVLWPHYNRIDKNNENNNSIVLKLTYNEVAFIFTGDAETDVWHIISNQINNDTKFFKIPHHGSENGSITRSGGTPWLDVCPNEAILGISSHVKPFHHPDHNVIAVLNSRNRKYLRTDEHYDITISTDGHDVKLKYSH
jgi:competence protein ComEC